MVQGEVGEEFFIIIEGSCSVHIDGKQIEGAECKEGDYVGELALLSADSKRTATVRAKSTVTCLACNAKTFEGTIKGSVTWSRRNKQRKAVGGKKRRKKRKKKKVSSKPDALSADEIKFLVGAITQLDFFSDYSQAQLEKL